jgi:sugar O-acyltransferase (sialic acid O-acetyltransferase NeuD family)
VERARPESEAKGTEPSGTRLFPAALELLRRHGLSPDLFVGRAMVTRADVEAEIDASAARSPQIDRTQAPEGPRVVLLGGGGHAKMCIDILRQMSGLEIIGILDAKHPCEPVLGVPFIAGDSDEDLARLRKQAPFAVNAVGAVRSHADRQGHYARLKKAGFSISKLIHPKAIVEPSVMLGEGNQIMAGAVVGSGNNSIVNSGAVLSHDCSIGDNAHLAPGAILAGGVRVGSGTLVGVGVTVYLGVRIGQGVTINNGLDVHADVHDHAVVKRD